MNWYENNEPQALDQHLSDSSGFAAGVTVYGASDNYSYRGDPKTHPCVPMGFRHVRQKATCFEKDLVVGTSSVILPGAHLHDGISFVPMTLVVGRMRAFTMYAGAAARVRDLFRDLIGLKNIHLTSKAEGLDRPDAMQAPNG